MLPPPWEFGTRSAKRIILTYPLAIKNTFEGISFYNYRSIVYGSDGERIFKITGGIQNALITAVC